MVWALATFPWAFCRSNMTLTFSLNPASANAFSNPLWSFSEATVGVSWVTPILKTFLTFFSWARREQTDKRRIKIKGGYTFFHIFTLPFSLTILTLQLLLSDV